MKSVNELLTLFMRQAQLERAMKQPAGARVIEERDLFRQRSIPTRLLWRKRP
jgi:hypothetical protein